MGTKLALLRPGLTPAFPRQPAGWFQSGGPPTRKDDPLPKSGCPSSARAAREDPGGPQSAPGWAAPSSFSSKLLPGRRGPRAGGPATGAKLRKGPATTGRPRPRPWAPPPASGGGGAAQLPERRAVFGVTGVPARGHGKAAALRAQARQVRLAVAARAAAAGEGGGALQLPQLSDCEERR